MRARRVGGPEFRAFFPSPATIFIPSSLSVGVFSWNFRGVFERRDPEMCTFGVLGLTCESPGVKPDIFKITGPGSASSHARRTPCTL